MNMQGNSKTMWNQAYKLCRMIMPFTGGSRVNNRRRWLMTMPEVLAAFMLTGVTLSATMAFLDQGLWGFTYATRRSTACDIAKNRIEQLRALPYIDLSLMAEEDLPVNADGIPDADGLYRRTTEIGLDLYGSRTATVTISSTWKYDRPEVDVTVATVLVDKQMFR